MRLKRLSVEQIDMVQNGKWLAADCGAIKPVR